MLTPSGSGADGGRWMNARHTTPGGNKRASDDNGRGGAGFGLVILAIVVLVVVIIAL